MAVPKWGSPSSENSSGVPSWGKSEGKPQWGNGDKQGASWGRGASPATPAPTPASATPQEPETQGSGNSNNRPDNGKKGKGSKNTPHPGIHMTTGKLVAVILVVAALIAGGMVAYSSLNRSSEPTQQQTQNANKPVIVGEDKSGSNNSDLDADKNTQESEEYSKSLEKDRQSAIQNEADKRLTEGDSQGAEYMRELKDSGIKNIDNNIPSPAKEKVTKAIQALANGSCKDASDVLGGVLSCTSDDFTKFDAGKVTVNNGVTNDSGVKTYTITFPDNAGSAVVSLNSSNNVTSFMLANALTPLPDGYGD